MKRFFAYVFVSLIVLMMAGYIPVYAATLSDVMISDMSQPNEGKLHGVPDSWDWNIGPVLSSQTIPDQYGAIQGWGHIYEAASGNSSTNTRVQIRDMETWWLSNSTNQWTRIQSSPNNVEGQAFVEDFAGNASTNPDLKVIDGYQAVRPGGGFNFHFWHAGGGYDIPNKGDFKAIMTVYRARLVLDNPSGPDDRAQAKYLAASAMDLYFSVSNHGTPPIPNMGIGRAKYVTNDWQWFTFNSASKSNPALIQSNPPPLTDATGGGGSSPTPNPSCAKKAQGDANCDGNVSLVDYEKWRQEFAGTLTTKTADFNSSGSVTLADYETWRRTFLGGSTASSPTPTTTSSNGVMCFKGKNVKIMPMGDSITSGADLGYRKPIQNMMRADGVIYDMVGNRGQVKPQDWVDWAGNGIQGVWYGTDYDDDQNAAANPGYDSDWEGHGGFQAGQPRSVVGYSDNMVAQMAPWDLPTYKPDIIIYHLGTNDVLGGWTNHGGWSDQDAQKNVLDLLDKTISLSPNALVYVSQVGKPGGINGMASGTIDSAVKNGVTQRIAAGNKRLFYMDDIYNNFTSADSDDSIHPNGSGYPKMAAAIYAHLKPVLVNCTP